MKSQRQPLPTSDKKRAVRARPVTRDDPLFGLIGIGKSRIPGGISEQKHEALARAYRPKRPENDDQKEL